MLEFDDLSRRFGTLQALDHLTFSAPSGEVFGFLGPNGAGKTTAMRALFGLVSLDAGQVRWKGAAVTAEERHRFGYLPEERGLYPGMVVFDQLVYLARLHGLSAPDARAEAARWLERLGIAGRRGDKVEALSLGNQQRVQLAAAMVHGPELLVLDEPFSGLDPTGIDAFGEILAEEAARGRGVLFSSHQLDLVESLCHSVAIINQGRIVVAGTVEDLLTRGPPGLVVQVAGDTAGAWARHLAGVEVTDNDAGRVRLALAADRDPQAVLAEARAAGGVEYFAFDRRRLSEVFRQAIDEQGPR